MPATVTITTGLADLATPTVTLFPDGSDTAAETGTSATQATNRKGVYTFSNTTETGLHRVVIVSGGVQRWYAWAILATDGSVEAYDSRQEAILGQKIGSDGVADVNTVELGGDSQSATDLKHFADSGYDPATSKVQGVVLVDTTTTNTDMRGTDNAATASELAKVPKSDGTVTWNSTALASINAEVDTALGDYDAPTKTEMDAAFTEIKGATWSDTSDTLEHIRNKQTDIETDTQDIQTKIGTPAGASLAADIADVPTVAEFEARTLAAADYFDPANDTVVNVTNVAALGENAIDGLAIAADAVTEIQSGLATGQAVQDVFDYVSNDLITYGDANWGTATGFSTFNPATDPVTLATTQPNYAPAKAGDAMALTSSERTTLASVIWDVLTSGLATVGSIGKLIVDNLNATVSSRATQTSVDAIPTTIRVKKNTALAGFTFPMVDANDTLLTGLTVTSQRILDGGAIGSTTNSVTENGSGFYSIDLTAADLNGNNVVLRFSATGAKNTIFVFVTQP